ncbi:RIP homotypic interaction motif-containing protein [Nonomuraea fuscirosea]|uniref:RIP homotypic interaction motif-containing protein n=1 Tax=Nonomuraea fuscirosea TaxID=1291556 RepID=UPI0037111140
MGGLVLVVLSAVAAGVASGGLSLVLLTRHRDRPVRRRSADPRPRIPANSRWTMCERGGTSQGWEFIGSVSGAHFAREMEAFLLRARDPGRHPSPRAYAARESEAAQPAVEPEIILIRECAGIQIGRNNSQITMYDIVVPEFSLDLGEAPLAALFALISQARRGGFFTDLRISAPSPSHGSSAESVTSAHPDGKRLIVIQRSYGVQIGDRCFQRNTFTLLVDGLSIRLDSLHLRSRRLEEMRRVLADPSDRSAAARVARDIVDEAFATLMARLEREAECLAREARITGLRSLYRRFGVSMGFHNKVRVRWRFNVGAVRLGRLSRLLTDQILRYARGRPRQAEEARSRTRERPRWTWARESRGPRARDSGRSPDERTRVDDFDRRTADTGDRSRTGPRPSGEREARTGRAEFHDDGPHERFRPHERPEPHGRPGPGERPEPHERPEPDERSRPGGRPTGGSAPSAAAQPPAHEQPPATRRRSLPGPAQQSENGTGNAASRDELPSGPARDDRDDHPAGSRDLTSAAGAPEFEPAPPDAPGHWYVLGEDHRATWEIDGSTTPPQDHLDPERGRGHDSGRGRELGRGPEPGSWYDSGFER